jgi:hypothetical protein
MSYFIAAISNGGGAPEQAYRKMQAAGACPEKPYAGKFNQLWRHGLLAPWSTNRSDFWRSWVFAGDLSSNIFSQHQRGVVWWKVEDGF